MEYTNEVLNRVSGCLETVSIGNFITVTELGESYGVGSRTVRTVLHHIGLLAAEGRHGRYRLTPEAVSRGFGRRITPKKKPARPFDVISPKGQFLIAQSWDDARKELHEEKTASELMNTARRHLALFAERRRHTMELQEQVCWLRDHYESLTNRQISQLLDCSEQMVGRYSDTRARHREYRKRGLSRWLPEPKPVGIARPDDHSPCTLTPP